MTDKEAPAEVLDGKTGQGYVETLRAVALLATVRGSRVLCGTCPNNATHIGMQRCGAPGGPICDTCMQNHRQWMDTACLLADFSPYCRHCGDDVDRDHIYALSLYDSTVPEVAL